MFSLDAAVKSKRKTTSKTRTTATAPKVMEGKITEYGNLITFQNFTIKKGESEISVDYPIAGDPTLVNPIRSYIVKAITGKTDATAASLSTPKNLLTSTIRKYKSKGYWGMTDGSVFTLNIKVVFKNDKVITIENSGYEYEGGAHGTGWDRFITYLLSDGTYLSYDMIPSFKTLKPYILSSLEKVFGIPAYKFNDEGIYVNELPDGLPYINENGVNFTYGEYEIGPYSLGLPTATIPFSTMRILCSGKALNFF
ncbi:MAG: DUF3298 and DUF4163 domain-containing protein [Muribaculaceae bacterium]|nr:DUF3298 and DUF4163 domain-containing protein [Muribaculaceae bacterium]